jgi:hypothetical protein
MTVPLADLFSDRDAALAEFRRRRVASLQSQAPSPIVDGLRRR